MWAQTRLTSLLCILNVSPVLAEAVSQRRVHGDNYSSPGVNSFQEGAASLEEPG